MGILSICGEKRYFYYFEEMSKIPHGSFHTQAISNYLVSFAKSKDLKYVQDDSDNVVMYKDASKGYENVKPVILQAHIDMVCVHTPDYEVDMTTVPVKLCTDGKWIWADRTSLGGDDMSGVAIILSILEDKTLKSPAIEAIFTSNEEPGMLGAMAFNMSLVKGRSMINLDCGPDDSITVNCAGGVQVSSTFPVTSVVIPNGYITRRITIDGLLGGHSGSMINMGRANAIILLCELLFTICEIRPVMLCEISGGNVANAICSSATAVIAIPLETASSFQTVVAKWKERIIAQYSKIENSLDVRVMNCENKTAGIESERTFEMMSLVSSLPQGCLKLDSTFENVPQTSLNIGIIRLQKESLQYVHYIRSTVDSDKEELEVRLGKKAFEYGGTCHSRFSYPGWEYSPVSDLRTRYIKSYERIYGKEVQIISTHGGLECGVFSRGIPGLDIIAIGATKKDIHSTSEKLEVESMVRLHEVVCDVLEKYV